MILLKLSKTVKVVKVANSDETETETFNFIHFAEEEIKNEILNVSSKKSTRKGDILAKVLKDSINLIYSKELTTIRYNFLDKGLFPDEIKINDVSPIFKKEKDSNKEKYRPVSILSHMSKDFERLLHKLIYNFVASKFSRY